MAIIIRHNSGLNAAASGLQEGLSEGLAARDRNTALAEDRKLQERRLRLAETVQAAESEIRAAEESRRAQAFEIHKQNEAGQREAAGAISEYATGHGQDPNFQPNYVETADPIEQQLHANAAHAARIGKLVAAKDPSLLPMFLEETHKAQHAAMLKGLAARELSAWQSMGTSPTMGPAMQGEGNQLATRAKQAMDALQAAMGDGTQEPDPQALQQAVALSAAARNESMMQQAKLQDQQAEAANLTALYTQQINDAEAGLLDPRLSRVLSPEVRASLQGGITRARLALGAYNASLGQPGGMTATKLHDAIDAAFRDVDRVKSAMSGKGGKEPTHADEMKVRAQLMAEWKAMNPDVKNELGHVTQPGKPLDRDWLRTETDRAMGRTKELPPETGEKGGLGLPMAGGEDLGAQTEQAAQPEQAAPVQARPFTELKAPDRARFVTALRAAVLRGDHAGAQAIMQQSGVDMDSIPKAVRDQILGATNAEKKKGRDKEAERELDQMYGNSDMPR